MISPATANAVINGGNYAAVALLPREAVTAGQGINIFANLAPHRLTPEARRGGAGGMAAPVGRLTRCACEQRNGQRVPTRYIEHALS